MKKKFIFLFLSAFLMGYPQSFKYKKVDQNLQAKTAVSNADICITKEKIFANAKSLTAYLPAKFDQRGKTDYTDFLQKGINENTDVIFPNFPVLIAPKGLALKSNTNILFLQNSKLKIKPNDKEFYAALNFENVENIQLYFPNLEGERYEHQNKKGEWGMGIYIVHSKNIFISKPHITKFWGDGIYIGKVEGITSKNIAIDGAFIDENRRNGISIISGDNIKITNSVISNTYGANPEYGIDLEPNKPEDELTNIILENNVTYNNYKGGVLFALDNLKGINAKEISVKVNNHTDYLSDKGIEFFIDRGYSKSVNPVKGSIVLNDIKLFQNKNPLINNDGKMSSIKLQLSKIYSNNILMNTGKLNNFVNKFQKGKQEKID